MWRDVERCCIAVEDIDDCNDDDDDASGVSSCL